MTTPTPDDVAALVAEARERIAAATSGPWRVNEMSEVGHDWLIGTVFDAGAAETPDGQRMTRYIVTTDGVRGSELGEGDARTDAEFIAWARNNVTRLAAALEAAQAREAFVLKAAWPSWMHDYTRAADALSVAAQTTGGVAGPDQGLMDAISRYAEARAIVRQKTADFARAALGDAP